MWRVGHEAARIEPGSPGEPLFQRHPDGPWRNAGAFLRGDVEIAGASIVVSSSGGEMPRFFRRR